MIVVIEPSQAELLCRNSSGGATATSAPAPAAAAAVATALLLLLLLCCCLSDGVVLGLPLSVSPHHA